jgi:hypothetical protein
VKDGDDVDPIRQQVVDEPVRALDYFPELRQSNLRYLSTAKRIVGDSARTAGQSVDDPPGVGR